MVAVLGRFGIRFHLTGGITVVAYGEPHMTQDLDRVIDFDAERRDREGFLGALSQAGFHLELKAARKALARSVMADVLPCVTLPIASRSDAALSTADQEPPKARSTPSGS